MKKTIASFTVSLIALLALAGCGSQAPADNDSGEAPADVREITISASPGYKPITYTDEAGNLDGYDVAVFREIDELLPEYEFTFEVVDKETMNIGVETGKYQIGINGMFRSADREAKYYIPENQLGATRVGFVVKKGTSGIGSWDDAVGKNVSPTGASGGIFGLLNQYNDAHPDAPIVFETVSKSDIATDLGAVKSGQYDIYIHLVDVINQLPAEVMDGLEVIQVDKIATFPIINKSETELGDTINDLLLQLREDGTLSRIAEAYYGTDVFAD
ncbi:MAG: transporter substrate-binding domain-containing protein [Clostridiales Family XIII bacterium]|jgi:ABC-type amino acid transport substrate-binding protein|nr:transporter substrate-binding domain-containing protein [Clostridiales Family XIII bacterium]